LKDREQIVGIETQSSQKAYPFALLRQQVVVNDSVGSTAVLLVVTNADTINAFARTVRGRNLTSQAKPGTTNIQDKETGSTWKLQRVTRLPSFWFSCAQFFPTTEVYSLK
jgi:hypothetical protein